MIGSPPYVPVAKTPPALTATRHTSARSSSGSRPMLSYAPPSRSFGTIPPEHGNDAFLTSNGAKAPGTAADAATAWDIRVPEVDALPITQSPTTSRSKPNRTPVVTLDALKMNRHPVGSCSREPIEEPAIERIGKEVGAGWAPNARQRFRTSSEVSDRVEIASTKGRTRSSSTISREKPPPSSLG